MRALTLAITLALVVSPAFGDDHKDFQRTKLSESSLSGSNQLVRVELENNLTVKGYFKSDKSKFRDLIVYGQVELEQCDVKGILELHGRSELESCQVAGKTDAYGRSEIEKSHFASEVQLHGETDIEDSNFQSNVTIHGNAKIEDSSFAQSLTAHGEFNVEGAKFVDVILFSQQAQLKDTLVKGTLTFNKAKHPQTLKLVDTTIKGDVVFVSGDGKIIKDEISRIEGTIQGGVVTTLE